MNQQNSQVYPFTHSFRGYKHLAILTELIFRVNTGTRRIPVADFHSTVYLINVKAPLAKLAKRSAIVPVTNKIIESIFVLGKNPEVSSSGP